MNLTETILGFIGAAIGGGGLTKIVEKAIARRQKKDEGDASVAIAAIELAKDQREDTAQHFTQIADCERRAASAEARCAALEKRVEELEAKASRVDELETTVEQLTRLVESLNAPIAAPVSPVAKIELIRKRPRNDEPTQ